MASVYTMGGVLIGAGTTALALAQDGRWGAAVAFGAVAIVCAAIAEFNVEDSK